MGSLPIEGKGIPYFFGRYFPNHSDCFSLAGIAQFLLNFHSKIVAAQVRLTLFYLKRPNLLSNVCRTSKNIAKGGTDVTYF